MLSHALETGLVGRHTQVANYISGGAITAGHVVRLDLTAPDPTLVVVEGAADALGFGVALDACVGAGEDVRVAVCGYVVGVDTDAGAVVAAGDSVVAIAGGLIGTATGAETYAPLGVALETAAPAGAPVNVLLYGRPGFLR